LHDNQNFEARNQLLFSYSTKQLIEFLKKENFLLILGKT